MRKLIVLMALFAALAGMLLLTQEPGAERLEILDGVEITGGDGCAFIRIGFNIPVRYVKHFPYDSGEDLRIQLEPISISPGERPSLFNREYLRPPPDDPSGLSEVLYEGGIEGGPFLSLFFRNPVRFKVEQGEDYRSLLVTVYGTDAKGPCQGAH